MQALPAVPAQLLESRTWRFTYCALLKTVSPELGIDDRRPCCHPNCVLLTFPPWREEGSRPLPPFPGRAQAGAALFTLGQDPAPHGLLEELRCDISLPSFARRFLEGTMRDISVVPAVTKDDG